MDRRNFAFSIKANKFALAKTALQLFHEPHWHESCTIDKCRILTKQISNEELKEV